ncbi:MAG: hypothetical protein KGY49_10295, partial [Wenzhouxiangellaceae bacterium]|nr:hypothetical protein [Wenzhouxiangellaceae bacterium]
MKRKTLTTAVMAGLTGVAGMVSVANAVNVNPDGLGQVLLYPYYTARGGNDTLISVVNTTSQGKAVKVRFLEALNSREVLDFNLYLSPFDVWTAAVTDLGNIEDSGYESFGISTTDTSCTAPYFFGDQDGYQDFLNFQYASEPFENPDPGGSDFAGTLDGGPTGLERTASGYIEIIEMGTLVPNPEDTPAADGTDPAIVPYWVEHAGITGEGDRAPRNCDAIVDQWREVNSEGVPGIWETTDAEFGFDEAGPSGGLMGAASIIDVTEGLMFSYNATAIDNFWAAGQTFHTDPGTLAPSLASSENGTSEAFISNVG